MKRRATHAGGEAAPLALRLPATSANLGPGFDAAACALDLRLAVRAQAAPRFALRATGRDRAICGALEGNLLLETYREVLAGAGARLVPLSLCIHNAIPIGKGCGSSAAARLAGIALAVHFGRLRWREDDILAAAMGREGHADNAAACWHGGFVAVAESGGTPQVLAGPPPAWRLILAVPPDALATEQARAALPPRYARADAVANVQAGMLLSAAFLLGRRDLLPVAMRDRLHEPYRAELCPLLGVLKPLAGGDGIAGVALSGAGPAVLAILEPSSAAAAQRRIRRALRAAGLRAELLVTRTAARGARQDFRVRRRS